MKEVDSALPLLPSPRDSPFAARRSAPNDERLVGRNAGCAISGASYPVGDSQSPSPATCSQSVAATAAYRSPSHGVALWHRELLYDLRDGEDDDAAAAATSFSLPPCVLLAFFSVENYFRGRLPAASFSAVMIRSMVFLVFLLGIALISAILFSSTNDFAWASAGDKLVTHQIDPIPAPLNSGAKGKPDDLRYAIAVDCGSSGSRLFVYVWPTQQQQADLLQISELKDSDGKSVIKKIEPGISSLAETKSQLNATEYIRPLLRFAAKHIPRAKHKATPLFILATAGMRMLPKSKQEAIFADLRLNVKKHFDFVYGDHNFQVISGKDEGVFQWIAANYMLGKFKHILDGDDPLTVVHNPSSDVVRKRTVGILDMGGGSLQIAFEITKNQQWKAIQGEPSASDFIADFNLGCQQSDMKHHYRLYVTTFLGFGGNAIIKKYYRRLALNHRRLDAPATSASSSPLSSSSSSPSSSSTLGSSSYPINDPCLSKDEDHVVVLPAATGSTNQDKSKDKSGGNVLAKNDRLGEHHDENSNSVHFRGTGNFLSCVDRLVPFLQPSSSSFSSPSMCPFNSENVICSVNGTFQPKVSSYNSEFYGFSEFFYSSYDILGLKGRYDAKSFVEKAQGYCATPWNVSLQRHSERRYPMANMYRLRSQCIKSAYVYAALHRGFKFPTSYSALNNEQLIRGQEIQWTLGALLYRMRFYPLADQLQHQQQLRQHGGGIGGGVIGGVGKGGSSGVKSHYHHEFFFDRDIPFSQYLLLALIVLFIGVIAILTKRLRRWLFLSPSSSSSEFSSFKCPESLDETPGGRRLRKSSESRESLLV